MTNTLRALATSHGLDNFMSAYHLETDRHDFDRRHGAQGHETDVIHLPYLDAVIGRVND
jgi:hypothetical protein